MTPGEGQSRAYPKVWRRSARPEAAAAPAPAEVVIAISPRERLDQELKRASRALAFERVVPLIVAPLAFALGWAALSLFGLLDRIPPLAASLAVIAALALTGVLAGRAVLAWRRPSLTESRHRLERDAGLDQGALDGLEDQPASLDPLGLALWRRQQARGWDAAARAKAAPPRPDLARADPYRLRWVAPAVLVIGVAVAQWETPDRLFRAFAPDPGPLLGDGPIAVEAWAAPAAYTGAAPVSLSDRDGQAVRTPPSIEATVRVTGPVGAPKLVFTGVGGRKEVVFKRAADGAWEAKLAVPGRGELKVVRFHAKARWRLEPAPDARPAAQFVGDVVIKDGSLVFTWSASDDFGVRNAALRLVPANPPEGLKGAPPLDVPLETPMSEPKQAGEAVVLNLESNPYAGLDVKAQIVVRDALGQEGAGQFVDVKLPEKVFLQPLARAAIEIRKAILWERRAYAPLPDAKTRGEPATIVWPDPIHGEVELPVRSDDQSPRLERAPSGIRRAVRLLDALSMRPGDGYFSDPAVFLGFAAARSTLAYAAEIAGVDPAADILWETALRAEYGDSADAWRALQMAQKALSEAMRRGADPDEISRLSQAMREAAQRYMEALVQEALRRGEQPPNMEDGQAEQGQRMTQNDIQEMLKEVERLANEGRHAEAEALMRQITEMLANMQVQLARGSGEGGENQEDAQLNQQIEDLSGAMGRQRDLRDDTQREEQNQAGGDRQQQSPDQLANRQEQLRRELEKAERGARGQQGEGEGKGRGGEEASEALDRAGRAMDQAGQSLRRGDFEGAQKSQDEALRQMRAGAEALGKEALGRREARRGEQNAENDNRARDPLGRPLDGAGDISTEGDGVTVPDAIQKERAREILDELRRRAQDPTRPEQEREYIRRLLDRFAGS
jgi:hypothetical protein